MKCFSSRYSLLLHSFKNVNILWIAQTLIPSKILWISTTTCFYQRSQKYTPYSWLISNQTANCVELEDSYVKYVKIQAILFSPLIHILSSVSTVQRCFTSKYDHSLAHHPPPPIQVTIQSSKFFQALLCT